MWNTAAEFHSAINDLPIALLLMSVAFDISGSWTKRESLKAAGFWCLVVGAAGALLTLISGLRAEASIEHGGAVHMVMERHKTMAIAVTVMFSALAAWRIWRRGRMGTQERPTYLAAVVMSALILFWTAHLGGTIVFRHGGGIPTDVLEAAMADREAGHTHAPGEEHDDSDASAPADSMAADTTAATDHVDPPGTPEHEHN